MKNRLFRLLCLCAAAHMAVCAPKSAAADEDAVPDRNRLTLENAPALAFSVATTVDILDSDIGGELWRINLQPVVAAEIVFTGGLIAGIALPFTIQTGYRAYNSGSIAGAVGPPQLRADYAGSKGPVSYRVGVSYTPSGTSAGLARAAEAVPVAGGSISVACIRDPAAIKFEADTEVGPARRGGQWRVRRAGGTLGLLAVLNEVISVELALLVHLQLNAIASVQPPSIFGRTGVYARMNSLIASLTIGQNVWNPTNPASVSAGIGISWGGQ